MASRPARLLLPASLVALALTACGERPGHDTRPDPPPVVLPEEPVSAQPPACTPRTCSDLAATACGNEWGWDGCGARLSCGSCPAGEGCDGGNLVPGHCRPCDPLFTSCAEAGVTCNRLGRVRNGCGEELDCGACPETPVRSLTPLRVASFGTAWPDNGSAAFMPGGDVTVAWYSATTGTLLLERLTRSRREIIAEFPVAGGTVRPVLTAGPSGSVYLRLAPETWGTGPTNGAVDLGAGARTTPYLAQLDRNGSLVRELCVGPEPCSAIVLAADERGNVVLREPMRGAPRTRLLRADGTSTLLALASGGGVVANGCVVAAFHPDGDVVCGGAVPGTYRDGYDQLPAYVPSLSKVSLEGNVRWSAQVDGMAASVSAVAVDPASGAILAAGVFVGFARFGDDTLWWRMVGPMDPSGYVLGLSGDGVPLFARDARDTIGTDPSALAANDGAFAVVSGAVGPFAITTYGRGDVAEWKSVDGNWNWSFGRISFHGSDVLAEQHASRSSGADGALQVVRFVP